MTATAILLALSGYPSFLLLIGFPTMLVVVLIICWLSLLKTAYSGVLPLLMAELFPTRTRGSGVALSYNSPYQSLAASLRSLPHC